MENKEYASLNLRLTADKIARIKTVAAAKYTSAANILDEAFAEYCKHLPADLKKGLDLIAPSESQSSKRPHK